MKTVSKLTLLFGLKIKKEIIQDAIFIHSDPGHAKSDKYRKK